MRSDRNAQPLPLSPEQRFFVSCWFNMVHQYSLDSHRARTMNPRNMLREVLGLYSVPHADGDDRAMACAEALHVLAADPILRTALFADTTNTLLQLLKPDSKGKISEENLMQHFARELLQTIEASYLDTSLSLLSELLLAASPVGILQERCIQLTELTSGLLSTLIDGGASLESLFQLYRQILVPRKKPGRYVFASKLALLTKILQQPPKTFKVLFSIDNVTNTEDFPPLMGGISFSNAANGWAATSTPALAYLTPHSRRLFSEVTIQARDLRSAGTEAYAKISNVLDLTRFEYERERVHLSEEFLISETEHPQRVLRYSIPKVVPNPAAKIETPELESFVMSVNELLSTGKFSQEGRDRVLSAFRLYRLGSDTHSFDNKLTNWWTAVEFLVRGLKGGRQIGVAVEFNLTPVLCLAYATKLLVDIRQTLQEVGAVIVDPNTSLPIELRRLDLLELHRALCRSDIQPLVSDALSAEPYIQFKTNQTLRALSDPQTYLVLLKQHEQRVGWQIQRLWRARCEIVHSAKRSISDVMLCANLEFYLKIVLMSLLTDLRRIKTLGSPEEFFERKAFLYKSLKSDMEDKSIVVFEATLVTGIPS
jgi:hypothetical protein